MESKKLLAGHRLKEPVQAVDDNDAGVRIFHTVTNLLDEFAWRHLRRVEMIDADLAVSNVLPQVHAQAFRTAHQRVHCFFEDERGSRLSALGCTGEPAQGNRGFSASCRTDQQRARTAIKATTDEGIQFGDAARSKLFWRLRTQVLGGDQARKQHYTAVLNEVVMIPLAKSASAQFCDFKPPPGFAILTLDFLKRYNAVHNAVQFQVHLAAAAVIEQKHRAV